jgi:hypothetical protein
MAFVGYERLAGGGAPDERPVEAIAQQLEDNYVFFTQHSLLGEHLPSSSKVHAAMVLLHLNAKLI